MADTMYHIDGFDEIIRKEFKILMEKTKLNFIDKSTKFGDDYRLVNSHCILRFGYDIGNVFCQVINPATQLIYSPHDLLLAVNKNEKNELDPWVEARVAVKHFAKLFEDKLLAVLLGTFPWGNVLN